VATITSAQTGNWSSGSTWIGGVPPGDGDVAVRSVNHVITIDQSVTIGANGAAYSAAIRGPTSTSSDSGGFVVADNVTVTLKGSFISGGEGSFITLGVTTGGAKLVFPVSISNNHKVSVGNGNGVRGTFTVNGASDNFCEINNQSTSSVYFQAGNPGDWWYYCESWYGSYLYLKNIAGVVIGDECQIDHWIFDSNSISESFWPLPNIPGDKDFIMNNCSFLNPSATIYLFFDDVTTGSRTLQNNVFVSELYWSGFVTWDGLVLLGGTNGDGVNKGVIQNSFVDPSAGSGLNGFVFSLVKDNFVYYPTGDNPHFLGATLDISTVFDGNIFEYGSDWSSDVGDCILCTGGASTSYTIVIKNNIELPNANGRQSGTMATLWANTYNDVQIYNNTFYTGVNIEDDGSVSLVSAFYNNLSYGPNGQNLTSFSGGGTVEDIYDDADYNSAQNLSDPYTDNSKFAISPGTNDFDDDPSFVDSSRDLAKWAIDGLGSSSGNEALRRLDAINALIAQNDPNASDYNVEGTVANLVDYIKAGFSPTNIDYSTSGKGGSYPSYIGAKDVQVPIENEAYLDPTILSLVNYSFLPLRSLIGSIDNTFLILSVHDIQPLRQLQPLLDTVYLSTSLYQFDGLRQLISDLSTVSNVLTVSSIQPIRALNADLSKYIFSLLVSDISPISEELVNNIADIDTINFILTLFGIQPIRAYSPEIDTCIFNFSNYSFQPTRELIAELNSVTLEHYMIVFDALRSLNASLSSISFALSVIDTSALRSLVGSLNTLINTFSLYQVAPLRELMCELSALLLSTNILNIEAYREDVALILPYTVSLSVASLTALRSLQSSLNSIIFNYNFTDLDILSFSSYVVDTILSATALELSINVTNIAYTDFEKQLQTDLENVFFSDFKKKVPCYYYHANGKITESYPCIFDDPSVEVTIDKAIVNGLKPLIQIPSHLLKHPIQPKKDYLTLGGVKYTVEKCTQDGLGVTDLMLSLSK